MIIQDNDNCSSDSGRSKIDLGEKSESQLQLEKSITCQLHDLHGDEDDMFRLVARSANVARAIKSPDESSLSEAMWCIERED